MRVLTERRTRALARQRPVRRTGLVPRCDGGFVPRPPVPREIAELIDRLEHRVAELEKEKRESSTAQARQP